MLSKHFITNLHHCPESFLKKLIISARLSSRCRHSLGVERALILMLVFLFKKTDLTETFCSLDWSSSYLGECVEFIIKKPKCILVSKYWNGLKWLGVELVLENSEKGNKCEQEIQLYNVVNPHQPLQCYMTSTYKCNTKVSCQRNTSPWLALGAEYLVLDFRMMFSWIWVHSLSLLHL